MQLDSEIPAHFTPGAVLGIPHEVRLKLAKRMREEQLRRYYERENQSQEAVVNKEHPIEASSDAQNSEEKRKNRRTVAFQAKELLIDAAQKSDREKGII